MIEWTNASLLRVTALGDLPFMAATGARYLLDQRGCKSSRTLRVVSDPIPQGDGEIFHRRFTDGTQIDFTIQLWDDASPACAAVMRVMYEDLSQWLGAMLNTSGRYVWQPSGVGVDMRMMDEARWLSPLDVEWLDGGIVQVKFSIDSPFPYYIDSTQDSIVLPDGVPVVITNEGNADFFPVIQVDGPTSGFTITNAATGQQIDYDASRPGAASIGGGDYAEIDTFQSKIYLNGDDDNLAAGIDPEATDYFVIKPDANTVEITGADATLLMNNAWLP